jgi:hypothetical protein
MVTSFGFVVENKHFSPKNGKENQERRQKRAFFASN